MMYTVDGMEVMDIAVVDVAEPRRFRFLGMMQTPGPVNHHIAPLLIEPNRTANAPRRVQLTKLK